MSRTIPDAETATPYFQESKDFIESLPSCADWPREYKELVHFVLTDYIASQHGHTIYTAIANATNLGDNSPNNNETTL